MAARSTPSDTRNVGHLFEFRTLEIDVPDRLAVEIEAAAEDVVRHARCREPGTRLFAVLRDPDRPGRFLCTAVFDDEDAARAHRDSPAALRFAALLLSLGAETRADRWTAVAGI